MESVAKKTFEGADKEAQAASRKDAFHIPPMPVWKEVLMVSTMLVAQTTVQALLSQGLLPDFLIGSDFGVSKTLALWGPAGYGLTFGTFVLPAGRIGDIFGYRLCFVLAWAWLSVSSLMAGVSIYSRSFIFYALCRGLQGLAAAMIVPCALAILGSVYKEGPRKNIIFSIYAAGSPIGFTIGVVFTAIFAQLVWWPWAFFVTAIICAVAGLLAGIAIPDLKEADRLLEPEEKLEAGKVEPAPSRSFDWLGCFTGVAGLVLFNVAWNQAPTVGWGSAQAIATLVIGVALFAAFIFVERKVKEPLVPVSGLAGEALAVLSVTGLAFASFGIMTIYVVNFTTQLRGDTFLSMAAQSTPVPFMGFAASLLASAMLAKGFSPPDIQLFSMIWYVASSIILATTPVHQLYWKQLFWFYMVAPFGIDLGFASATLALSNLLPRDRQGIAASLVATVVYYSQSFSLGVAGTVQAHVGGETLAGYRGAFYVAIGMSVLGFVIAVGPVIKLRMKRELGRR